MTTDSQATYNVSGMTCGHCEASVREEVQALAGVSAAVADRQSGTLVVTGTATRDEVAAAVRDAGYELV